VIYGNDVAFPVGGSKTLRSSAADVATVVGVGVTVFEALKACDLLAAEGIAIRVIDAYSVQPIDAEALLTAGRETKAILTVEDHYVTGGLGDAVAEVVGDRGVRVVRLGVREVPRSGPPDVLIDRFGLSAARIVAAVKHL
jgi:transketolase